MEKNKLTTSTAEETVTISRTEYEELLEQKRTRSQAALVEAILLKTTPKDGDVDYFNQFTRQIEEERAHLHELMTELESL